MWPSWSPGVATSTQKNRMLWIPAEILIIDVSVFLAVPLRYSSGQGSTMSWSHWGRMVLWEKKQESTPTTSNNAQILQSLRLHDKPDPWVARFCLSPEIPLLLGSDHQFISAMLAKKKQPWVPYSGLLKGFSRAGSRLSVPPVLSHGCYAAFEVLQGLDPQDQQDQGENTVLFWGMVQATKMSRSSR